jgi:hypothetical protein
MGTVLHPRSSISSRIGPYRKTEFCYPLFSDSSPYTTGTSRITMHVAGGCVTSPSSSIGFRSQHTHGLCQREALTALKKAVTNNPCLAHYDSSLPTFLKTDWSAVGMSYVLMQPADDPSSKRALEILQTGGQNTFDELMTGARLRPVRFGSRRCTTREQHFHSFVGEAVTGRWAIGQCRRYLWGGHFY